MVPSPVEVSLGSVLGETYRLEALIGKGGMGSVWLASHVRLPKRVAIKVLQEAPHESSEAYARFRREAEITSRLGHPNIVEVLDFNKLPQGIPYLVLEFLPGESLGARLRRGPLPLTQALSIARQLGSALNAAHAEGIVHRDLKPDNIFLCPREIDGEVRDHVKVLDFGISKIRGSKTIQTQESTLLGTPQYMSPEQARGDNDEVDHRTDIFALGTIVYEMLGGRAAFAGENLAQVVFRVVYEEPRGLGTLTPGLPPKVIDTIAQAMRKHRSDRFGNVSDFIEMLTGRPLAARHATHTPPQAHHADRTVAGFSSASGAAMPPGGTQGEPSGSPRVVAERPSVPSDMRRPTAETIVVGPRSNPDNEGPPLDTVRGTADTVAAPHSGASPVTGDMPSAPSGHGAAWPASLATDRGAPTAATSSAALAAGNPALPVALPAGTLPGTRIPRTSAWRAVGIAAVLGLGVAGGYLVATRDAGTTALALPSMSDEPAMREPTQPLPPLQAPVVVPDAAPLHGDAEMVTETSDAAMPETPDAGPRLVANATRPSTTPVPPVEPRPTKLISKARDLLKEAETFFQDRRYVLARHRAESALRAQRDAWPALLLVLRSYCAEGDLGMANATLRRLPRAQWKASIAACAHLGMALDP